MGGAKLTGVGALSVGMILAGGAVALGQQGGAAKPAETPLTGMLGKFLDAPKLGPAEEEVAPLPVPATMPANLPGKGLAQHSMLYVGEGYNKIFLVHEGKVIWTYSTGKGFEYDDVWMLSNGNILFTRMQYIAEVTPNKEVVWRYDAPAGTEIHGCQPIGLDKVLFVRNGLPPKLMVVNIKTKATEVEHDLPMDSKKGVHGQFRRIRYTAQGTYLVPFMSLGRVVEYDKDFKEIWSYPDTPGTLPAAAAGQPGEAFSPWAAIRLKNGNTLITNEPGKAQIEVSPDKKIVWQLKPEDLPEPYRYVNTQTCTRLANGNTIVCSRGGGGKGPQLVEVTPDKKVVWVLWDYATFGPATAVQVLDDPGVPENPGDSQH